MHGYYRFPTLSHDTIVFTSEDDLWSVSCTGGTARRLTSGAMVGRAYLSPDGARLAFTSKNEGNHEVYVMDSEGGEPTRLSFMGDESEILGWLPDSVPSYSQMAHTLLFFTKPSSTPPVLTLGKQKSFRSDQRLQSHSPDEEMPSFVVA